MPLVVQAHGGLGNQLFQAQYAHFLAKEFPQVKVHFRSTHRRDKRFFELENFFESCSHIKQPYKDNQFESYRNIIFEGLIRRNMGNLLWCWDYTREEEITRLYDLKKYQHLFRWMSIRGYFQSNEITADACFKSCFKSALENRLGKPAQNYETVVHIRKGDFNQFSSHGPLANSYFEKILSEIGRSRSVLHTDADPQQLSGFLLNYFSSIKYSHAHSSWSIFQDALECTNFVGSNSTLSWWAARGAEWLSVSKPKSICFPNKWTREQNDNQKNLLLDNWDLVNPIWVS